jgi:hypothetical protein
MEAFSCLLSFMHTFLASLRRIPTLVLIFMLGLHGADVGAAEPDPAMHAAAAELVTALGIDQAIAPVMQETQSRIAASTLEGLHAGIADNPRLSEAERVRAHGLAEELGPRIAAAVEAAFAKIEARTLMVSAYEMAYSRHFSAAEVRQLAAKFASARCQQPDAPDAPRKDDAPPARCPGDGEEALAAFFASPLGQKQRASASDIEKTVGLYTRQQYARVLEEVRPALVEITEPLWRQRAEDGKP